MEFFKHILTAKDGESYDIGRVSWLFTTLAIVVFACGLLYFGKAVTLGEFGITLAGNTTAHGAAIGLKAKTEPE